MLNWLLIGLLSLLGAAPERTSRTPDEIRSTVAAAAADDSARTRERMVLQLSEFHLLWQHYWKLSELERRRVDGSREAALLRLGYMHCHPQTASTTVAKPIARVVLNGDVSQRPYPNYPLIKGDSSWYAVCPTWLMVPTVAQASDESIQRDGALLPMYRSALAASRNAMLKRLDSAAAGYPQDEWYLGQRVRLRLDQLDTEGALRTVDSCRVTPWWCTALRGHVLWRAGRLLDAEAAFDRMRREMPADVRCRWSDVSELLPKTDATLYQKNSCAARDSVNITFWWLADPLFRQRGNERLVEQESRRVDIALRQQVGIDERNVWDVRHGGDAMGELIARYGWPSYAAWGGPDLDNAHSGYLAGNRSAEIPPYTTFEYSNDRAHFVARWSAVASPYAAEEMDWQLFGTTSSTDTNDTRWPAEHARVSRTVVQLRDGQSVFFRRQDHIAANVAVVMRDSILPAPGIKFDALLLRATDGTRSDSLAQQSVRGGETVVLRGITSSAPAVFAVEAIGLGDSRVNARTRYGATPPALLSAMRPGEVAVSEPVVIDVRGRDFGARTPADTLLDHMVGSLRFPATHRRLGVFWETYGVAAADTVTVRVRVRRDEEISAAQRIGMALNLTSDPNRPLDISWTEPDLQRATRTLSGPVPVQQRFLILNLEQLTPGAYVLDVRVERRGAAPAQSQRRVVLEK